MSAYSRVPLRRQLRSMRRVMLACLTTTALLATLSACGTAPYASDGPYVLAGGGRAGIYYTYGEQISGALQQKLGLRLTVEETQGSVDNLLRVASGEALFGFAQADTAADAITGSGEFSAPQPVAAVARVYDEYVHVVVPADSSATGLHDLSGLRVSLGAEGSGVQVIATRVLGAAGVSTDDIKDPSLSLDASIEAMRAEEIDAFFWVGGLPTPSIERLADELPLRMLSIPADVVERVNAGHAGVYRLAEFPIAAYGIEGTPSVTMTVPNFLVVGVDAPEALVYDVTGALFASRVEMAKLVSVAEFLDLREAIYTEPMPLHAGAARYYVDARR